MDARHSGGNPHFFFLPPMVPDPHPTGVFDSTRAPAVEICELVQNACVGAPIATFTFQSGPGEERLEVSRGEGLYKAKWRTDDFAVVDAGKTFRISVVERGVRFGFADVQVVNKSKDLKNIATGEYIGLVEDKSLNIKFRIEQGIFPLQFVSTGGDQQTAQAGATLPTPLGVRLTDASGYPMDGMGITYSVLSGGGTVSSATTVSDASGAASTSWTLGPSSGQQQVVASVAGFPELSATFNATSILEPPASLLGEWRGSLSGQPFSLQYWSDGDGTHAAFEIVARPRERLRIMGTAAGPPQTLYLWRGQDAAMMGINRASDGRMQLEYWEDGCARAVDLTYVSTTVPSVDPGADLSPAVENDHAGSWSSTISGSPYSITVTGSGSSTTATATFNLGLEQLSLLGYNGGAPRTLYFWRPQDHATIALTFDASGQRVASYWENGCARTAPLNPQ